jgi:hypothetical protein
MGVQRAGELAIDVKTIPFICYQKNSGVRNISQQIYMLNLHLLGNVALLSRSIAKYHYSTSSTTTTSQRLVLLSGVGSDSELRKTVEAFYLSINLYPMGNSALAVKDGNKASTTYVGDGREENHPICTNADILCISRLDVKVYYK